MLLTTTADCPHAPANVRPECTCCETFLQAHTCSAHCSNDCTVLVALALQVVFKPIPEVWGYFSVKGGGGIHEFSDSQVRIWAFMAFDCLAAADSLSSLVGELDKFGAKTGPGQHHIWLYFFLHHIWLYLYAHCWHLWQHVLLCNCCCLCFAVWPPVRSGPHA